MNRFKSLITRDKKILIVVITISALILCGIAFANLRYESTTNPDMLHVLFFSKNLQDGNGLIYCNENNLTYDTFIFGGRGFKYLGDGCYTHGSMHGFIGLIGLSDLIIPGLHYIVVGIFGVLSLLIIYKIGKYLYNENVAIIGVILALVIPSFFYHSITLFNNIVAIFFLLFYLYNLIKISSKEEVQERIYVLASSSISMAVWFRYEYIVFAIPYGIILLLKLFRKEIKFYKAILLNIPSLVILGALLALNYSIYGDVIGFVNSGVNLASSQYYGENVQKNKIVAFLPALSVSIFTKNFFKFVVQANPLLFITSILGVYWALKKDFNRRVLFALLFIALFPILFYLGSVWTGYLQPIFSVATSYSRYLLPSYIILLILSMGTFQYFLNSKVLTVIFLFFVLIYPIKFIFSAPGAAIDYNESQSAFVGRKEELLRIIPENGLVFVTVSDKYLFPDRQTMIYSSYEESIRISETVKLTNRMIEGGEDVYFMVEDSGVNHYIKYPSNEYFKAMTESGLKIKHLESNVVQITK
jgi:hypothetical protein